MTPILTAAQVFVIAVFGTAVVTKLRSASEYRQFTALLREIPLVSGRPRLVAAGVLAAEVLAVLLSAPPATARLGLLLAAGLLAGFAGAVAVAIRRGVRRACRCFGAASTRPMSRAHIVRNVAASVAVCAAAVAPAGPTAGAPVLLLSVFVGTAAAVGFVAADHLAFLFAPRAR